MKRARFTEEQIIGVLREHEAGAKTADLARKHGVSERRFTTGSPNSAVWTSRRPSGCVS
ncbi:transposase [Bradyrhizobium sp. 144]|nr:transposase [Bradyrhizobium sp. 144]